TPAPRSATSRRVAAMTARRTSALGTRRWAFGLTAAVISSGLAGCRGDGDAAPSREGGIAATLASSPPFVETREAPAPPPKAPAQPTPREDLGRRIFFDKGLSTPPGTSCASCHDPRLAFSGNNGSTIGVAAGSRPGHFA